MCLTCLRKYQEWQVVLVPEGTRKEDVLGVLFTDKLWWWQDTCGLWTCPPQLEERVLRGCELLCVACFLGLPIHSDSTNSFQMETSGKLLETAVTNDIFCVSSLRYSPLKLRAAAVSSPKQLNCKLSGEPRSPLKVIATRKQLCQCIIHQGWTQCQGHLGNWTDFMSITALPAALTWVYQWFLWHLGHNAHGAGNWEKTLWPVFAPQNFPSYDCSLLPLSMC